MSGTQTLDLKMRLTENGDQTVALEVVKSTLLHEYIRLLIKVNINFNGRRFGNTSSIKTIALQEVAISNVLSNVSFSSAAVVPKSPAPMMYRLRDVSNFYSVRRTVLNGLRTCSEVLSADNVLPTPGAPNRLMTKP